MQIDRGMGMRIRGRESASVVERHKRQKVTESHDCPYV